MQTTTTTLFNKAKRWCAYIFTTTFILTFLLLMTFAPYQSTAQQSPASYPLSLDLNLGSGLIGNPSVSSAFQPELGINYMPGRWGLGLNAGLYSFDSGFSADQYRTGYEQFTVSEATENQWEAFYINLGPRFEQSLSRFVSLSLGLDLAMSNQEAPSQLVRFNDPTGELESSGIDTDIVLAEMDGEESGGWTAAIRPQMQFEFKPGFSDRFSFIIKTGIQHDLSDREITYTERDLSRVMQVDSPFEMHHQFENAPVEERTESAPKTNFFANAGIKISFGGSRAPAAPAQDYNSNRSNKTGGSIANDGGGDCDDGDPRCTPGSSRAQDNNSSRSNKPSLEAALGDVVLVKGEGLTMVDSFIDEIIEVLDRCEDEVCTQVRQNADGRKDTYRQVQQNRISQDQGIEAIHSIVMEDVVSLQKCETDMCREVLTKEVQLLEHMNVLMSLVQSGRAAAAQDYNNEWDELIDESVELAQDNNSSRSNKPSTSSNEIGDGEEDVSGQQVVLITQDDKGKVYTWGSSHEAIMQDENGKLYAWGSGHEARLQGEDGKVYSWGVASSASLQSGDGEVYCWGDNSRASLQDGDGNVYCWGNNSRTSVDSCEGDSCPQPSDNSLFLAKELGLASVGDDIENIKQVLDRCDGDICGQVRLNADHRDSAVRRAQDNPADMDTHIDEIRKILKEDVESLGSCETDVCREALAMEEKLLVKMNRLSNLAQVAPARNYSAAFGNGKDGNEGAGDGPTKEAPSTYDVMHNGELFKICNTGADLDAISASDPDYDYWLDECESYGIGDDGGFPSLDAAHSLFTSGVNWPDGFNPAGTIISAGSVMISSHPESPIYEGDAVGGENILHTGEMNDSSEDDFNSAGSNSPIYEMADSGGNGDGDNNTDPLPSQRYDMQPSSYCVEVATMKMSTNSQKAMRGISSGNRASSATDYNSSRSNTTSSITRPDDNIGSDSTDVAKATSHNASRSNRSQGINDQDRDTGSGMDSTQIASATDYNSSRSNTTSSIADLGGDLDGDGFPDMLKNASFSISKRSARTGRSTNPIHEEGANTQKNPMYETEDMASGNGGDLDGDGLEDTVGIDIELEMGDPDSDDDGLMDAIESATYSISKRSARTGRTAMKNDQEDPLARESNRQESPEPEVAPPGNVHQWTYKLNALSDGDDLTGNGTLTVIMSGGKVHFNVQFDPDSDEDGYGELLQSSSFSISKRSARTGRNPQSSRE